MARIYSEQRPFMLRLARSLVKSPDDAEDIVQHAALVMCRWKTTIREGMTDRGFAAYMVKCSRGEWVRAEKPRARLFCSLEGRQEEHPGWRPTHPQTAEQEAMAAAELSEVAASAPVEAVLLGQGYLLREVAAMTGQDYRTIWSRVDKWRRERVKAQESAP